MSFRTFSRTLKPYRQNHAEPTGARSSKRSFGRFPQAFRANVMKTAISFLSFTSGLLLSICVTQPLTAQNGQVLSNPGSGIDFYNIYANSDPLAGAPEENAHRHRSERQQVHRA